MLLAHLSPFEAIPTEVVVAAHDAFVAVVPEVRSGADITAHISMSGVVVRVKQQALDNLK